MFKRPLTEQDIQNAILKAVKQQWQSNTYGEANIQTLIRNAIRDEVNSQVKAAFSEELRQQIRTQVAAAAKEEYAAILESFSNGIFAEEVMKEAVARLLRDRGY